MTPEGKVKKRIDLYLKSLGRDWWGFKPMMMGYGRKGIPDIIGCYKGLFVAIEVKAGEGKLTPWQEVEEREIKESGASHSVARSADDVKN
jgi:hypothetical protein